MSSYQPDHYRLLGLPPNADDARLKESYRRLSRVFHPDRQQGSRAATVRFQQIANAYAELSDSRRREQYDRLLLLRDPLRFVDDPRAERALDALDGVVKRLRRRKLPGSERGRDLRVRHRVPFRVAALGGPTQVRAQYRTACPGCAGEGTQAPDRNPMCHICAGDGRVKVGLRRSPLHCGFCDGTGMVLLAPCPVCEGAATVDTEQLVQVQVPRRCPDGAVLRVRGAGERPQRGGQSGDLVVDLRVEADLLLHTSGNDLLCTLPLTWSEAVCGCVVNVPTLEGTQRLRIAAGARSGQELRIAGRGLHIGRRRGDLRYTIQIDSPADLSASDRAAVTELEERIGRASFGRRLAFEAAVASLPQVDDAAESEA